MSCQFRYVEGASDAVVLRLFRDDVGAGRGDVSGPVIAQHSGQPADHVDRCILEAELAYFTAIRIANEADCELVVSGDVGLWDAQWGELVLELSA